VDREIRGEVSLRQKALLWVHSLQSVYKHTIQSTNPFVEIHMPLRSRFSTIRTASIRGACAGLCTCIVLAVLAPERSEGQAQASPALLTSRAELTAAATRAEIASTAGDPAGRSQNATIAAAIRERLREGDFQVGDRIVVTIISDAVHRDTIAVRSGRLLELPGMIVVPLTGVLRSELHDRISIEVLRYVKAQEIDVTPLIRIGVLGAVARPGYFAFASDIPLTDVIMLAGGPTGSADVEKSFIRRRNVEYRSAAETRQAIANGLTLDQFGLNAGDELVIGQRRELGAFVGMAGGLASILAVFVTLRHR